MTKSLQGAVHLGDEPSMQSVALVPE